MAMGHRERCKNGDEYDTFTRRVCYSRGDFLYVVLRFAWWQVWIDWDLWLAAPLTERELDAVNSTKPSETWE